MLITLTCGDKPSSNAKRFKSRSQTLWTVPISDSAVRSAKCRWPLANKRSCTRSRNSAAALTVKVVPMMPAGVALPSRSARSSSSVKRYVLPLPAPALMNLMRRGVFNGTRRSR